VDTELLHFADALFPFRHFCGTGKKESEWSAEEGRYDKKYPEKKEENKCEKFGQLSS